MPLELRDRVERAEQQGVPVPGGVHGADDVLLVAAAKKGHSPAFAALMERHERMIFFLSRRITRNREDAEDVTQQSFQKAFAHLNTFSGEAAFSTWLTRIAINEALMLLRKKRGSREISTDDPSAIVGIAVSPEVRDSAPCPEERFWRLQQKGILKQALRKLKPETRTVIELRDLDERSVRETAQIMGASVPAVKSRLHRGRVKLRKAFERYVEPGGKPRSVSRTASGSTNGLGHPRVTCDGCE
jgi:RNA polymerase sigma-70 factor (ECF subfamily)